MTFSHGYERAAQIFPASPGNHRYQCLPRMMTTGHDA